MNKDRELKIIIKADGSIAVNEIKIVAQSTDELEKQLKEARLEMGRLEAELDKVVGKTKGADTEINKLKTDSAALKNENKQLSSELQKVQTALAETTNRVGSLESRLKSATKDVKTFETSWSDLATGVNQALDILGKMKGYAEQGWGLAEQGTQLRAARDSFDNYTKSVGKSSEKILAKLKQASGGTINDMNLVKTASLAMSLGVTQDSAKMANLLEIARNKARLFGIGTQQAFEDIVTGIGRSSPKILDNLGIRIPAAFETMTDGMSDTEKVAKLFELTLEEGNKQLVAMGGLTDTKADSMQRLSASYDNLKASAGEFVFDALQPELEWLTKTISVTDAFINANGGLNSSFSDLIDTVELVGGAFAAWEIAVIVSKVADLAMKTEWLTKAQLALNVAMNANPYALLATGLTTLGIYLKQVQDETKEWQKYTEEQLKTLEEMEPTGKELSLQLQISFKEAEVAAIGSIDEIDRRLDDVARKAQERQKRDEQFVYRQHVQGRDDPGTFNNFVQQQDDREISQLLSQKAKIQQINNEILSLKDKLNSVFDEDDFGTDDFFKGFDNWEEVFGDLEESLNKVISNTDKSSGKVRNLKNEFVNLGASATKDLDVVGESFNHFTDDLDKLLDEFDNGLDDIVQARKDVAKALEEEALSNYKNLKNLDSNTAQWGMLNFAYSGYLNAGTDGEPLLEFQRKDKLELSKTIAEAVSAGFANADFSNLESTLGNVLSSILTNVVAQKNPVIDSAGAINWGNLGANLAVNAATKILTQPGRFFGGREEHGKESIQQSSDLKSRMGETWVDSYASEIMSVYATRAMKEAISSARLGYYGTSVGYSWNDSGDGIFSDRTRTYSLVDQGASAALEKLTKAMEAAEQYSKNVELSLQLQSAQGYEYKVLQEQIAAYEQSLSKVYTGMSELKWGDGTSNKAELTEMTYEIKTALAEMTREFASATAERSTNAAMGFMQYAPWLEKIMVPFSSPGSSLPSHLRANQLVGMSDGYYAEVSKLSRDEFYNAFETLQNNFADRKINLSLLDMVKDSGKARFDLEALKTSDPEAYDEQYLDYLDRQIDVFEEVMDRQAEIFSNESKSYEERVAALENYETSMEAYHQAKLDKLSLEKAQEEEEKRLMSEQRQARMESALSLVGELSQRGDKVVILQGGDANVALTELMEEFADNPEVLAVLKKTQEKNDAKARWG